MPFRFAQLTAMRLFVVMLLMTIGLHALAGSGPDIAPDRGSAFSAGTTEMAILSLRSEAGQQEVRFSPPTALPPLWLLVPVVVVLCGLVRQVAPRPCSTAAPAAEWYPPAVQSRGPPRS